MKTIAGVVLALSVTAAAGLMGGCEGDQSAPTPRRAINVDERGRENAEKRVIEQPQRDTPGTSGKEFPGQSKAPQPATVITADARKAAHGDVHKAIPINGSDSVIPESRYPAPPASWYPGPLPNQPENPGTEPMVGEVGVPGTRWTLDYSWGQVMVLKDYPHRDWPESSTTYMAATVKHNPVYYFNAQDHLPVARNNGTYGSDWVSQVIEGPWFYLQTLALPVYMVVEPPLSQVTTQRLGGDPLYFGTLPATGDIVPSPTPGQILWRYPFGLGMLGTRSEKEGRPIPPIPPTPGIIPAPPAVISPATQSATQPRPMP